ncbi:hypothetical protein BT63DRAFT_450494 [Microthyrium microscopicum]|uniref:Uncharacterized protein n=1 Tax=Microthyrium microscopicum TaxID=703497 RepID=A0A6A6UUQ8_9PEZI|nr:hypothetical protein BT63DRAFT_450494 [Microthyrium microscopicum]
MEELEEMSEPHRRELMDNSTTVTNTNAEAPPILDRSLAESQNGSLFRQVWGIPNIGNGPAVDFNPLPTSKTVSVAVSVVDEDTDMMRDEWTSEELGETEIISISPNSNGAEMTMPSYQFSDSSTDMDSQDSFDDDSSMEATAETLANLRGSIVELTLNNGLLNRPVSELPRIEEPIQLGDMEELLPLAPMAPTPFAFDNFADLGSPGANLFDHESIYSRINNLVPALQRTFAGHHDPPLSMEERAPDLWASISLWSRRHPHRVASVIIPPEPLNSVAGPREEGECQGIGFGTDKVRCTRKEIMEFRVDEYSSNNNIRADSGSWLRAFKETTSPYRLSRTHSQAIAKNDHFQLRNLLVSTSQHDAYYPRKWNVFHVDPANSVGSDEPPTPIMDLEHLGQQDISGCRITTLTTVDPSILFAGCFHGQYAYINLGSSNPFSQPPTTGHACSRDIINYVDSTAASPNSPTAVMATNDYKQSLVFLDCARNSIVSTHSYASALNLLSSRDAIVNCAATSPDGRLRALVGDFPGLLLTDARSGLAISDAVPMSSSGPRAQPASFAVAWAPDSVTLATGSEDGRVRLWDARMWRVHAHMDSIMANVRTLRFAPAGSSEALGAGAGAPVLIAAEAVDLVHVLDGQNGRVMQSLHYFGECAGLSIAKDASSLMLANSDSSFGGLMVWEQGRRGRYRRHCEDYSDSD